MRCATIVGLVMMVGCGNETGVNGEVEPLTDQVLWLEMTSASAPPCEGEVTFSFTGARLDGGGDLVFREQTEVASPAGAYAYVTRRGDGELVMNFDGEVFVGAFADASSIDVAWTSSEEQTELVEYQDEYRFEGVEIRTVDQTFALVAEGDRFTGTLTVGEGKDLSYAESDEWNVAKSGITQSSISTFNYLEPADGGFGFVRNDAAEDDCVEDTCELGVVETCTQTFDVTAWPIDGGIATFEALVGFDRPGGVPSTGFP